MCGRGWVTEVPHGVWSFGGPDVTFARTDSSDGPGLHLNVPNNILHLLFHFDKNLLRPPLLYKLCRCSETKDL